MNLNTATFLLVAALLALPSTNAWSKGEGHQIGQPGKASEVTRTVKVDMLDTMRFSPDKITVRQGETVRFVVVNKGILPHELVLGSKRELREHAEQMRKDPHGGHDDPGAVRLEPKQAGELVWKFTHAATVDFACLLPGHFDAGMVGQVKVTKG